MKNYRPLIYYLTAAMVGLFCVVLFTLFDFGINSNVTDEKTLVLVHTIFRHGERTVDPSTLYPNDPYINEQYYPYGIGQLTNAGKRREYGIGKALRKRYDKFLGKMYEPNILDAQSTEFNRTKMSLELVLAGLFPPVGDQIFEPALYWQPIPYNYLSKKDDKILLGILCPNYKKYYKKLINSRRLQAEFSSRKKLFKYLSLHSGRNITNYDDIFYLYFGLRSEREWGFELPSWTDPIYPQPLEDLVIKEYYIATGTTQLRKLASGNCLIFMIHAIPVRILFYIKSVYIYQSATVSGYVNSKSESAREEARYHLKKIIKDTQAKITGTLKPSNRKIFLYSAHESNIANFLSTLEIFEPHIPPYGCYILIEVHKIRGVYGVKIFYEDYIGDSPRLLKLPACDEFCPFSRFISIVEEYLPTEEFCYK